MGKLKGQKMNASKYAYQPEKQPPLVRLGNNSEELIQSLLDAIHKGELPVEVVADFDTVASCMCAFSKLDAAGYFEDLAITFNFSGHPSIPNTFSWRIYRPESKKLSA